VLCGDVVEGSVTAEVATVVGPFVDGRYAAVVEDVRLVVGTDVGTVVEDF